MISGIFLGLMWLGGAFVAASQVVMPWLIILTIILFVWYWNISSTKFRETMKGIFGWLIIVLFVTAGILTFLK